MNYTENKLEEGEIIIGKSSDGTDILAIVNLSISFVYKDINKSDTITICTENEGGGNYFTMRDESKDVNKNLGVSIDNAQDLIRMFNFFKKSYTKIIPNNELFK